MHALSGRLLIVAQIALILLVVRGLLLPATWLAAAAAASAVAAVFLQAGDEEKSRLFGIVLALSGSMALLFLRQTLGIITSDQFAQPFQQDFANQAWQAMWFVLMPCALGSLHAMQFADLFAKMKRIGPAWLLIGIGAAFGYIAGLYLDQESTRQTYESLIAAYETQLGTPMAQLLPIFGGTAIVVIAANRPNKSI